MPEFYPNNFGGLPPENSSLASSRFVILPLPYEATTSYGKGTKLGPRAIIEASRNMELYDEEVGFEASGAGIHTTEDLYFHDAAPAAMVNTVREAVSHFLAQGKFVISLGGEHSLTWPAFDAHRAAHGEIGVVQIDAHADLRDAYEGTPFNHACVMRRVVEASAGTAQIGIRSLSREEADFLKERGTWPVLWARECQEGEAWMDRALSALPEKVYLTVDLDGFDPSLVPCTGTPEPGGLAWYPVLKFLRRLCRERRVVGADLMELAPDRIHFSADFLAARLAYKIIAYVQEADRNGR
ncbi:MAG: agmatinase [Acidobacteriota bacterium]